MVGVGFDFVFFLSQQQHGTTITPPSFKYLKLCFLLVSGGCLNSVWEVSTACLEFFEWCLEVVWLVSGQFKDDF